MPTIQTIYLGDLRTEATHVRSGNKIITDAPVDNNGKGEFFSPTDMVAAALGSCMLTLMDLAARRIGVDIRNTKVDISKTMSSEPPRRITQISLDFYLPADFPDKTKTILQQAALTCPVGKSLHPDLQQVVNFHYPDTK